MRMNISASKRILCLIALHMLTFLGTSMSQADTIQDYTISVTLEVLKPIGDVSAMSSDAQSVRIIEESQKTVTIEVKVKPFKNQISNLIPNPHWKTQYAENPELEEFLRPGITTNWDLEMRLNLITALKSDGINPENLTDVELVKSVSNWILKKFKYVDHFISFDVDFINGKAVVAPDLYPLFAHERDKNHFSSDQEAIEKGIYGKSMFQSRIMGNCTMTATLQATIFKALGIPTRLVSNILAADTNSLEQVELVSKAINHHQLNASITPVYQKLKGFVNHTFNEVFVGGQWVRLNYNILGQSPVWDEKMGLMIQVDRLSDWGLSKQTSWARQWQGTERPFNAHSANPYRMISIKDNPSVLNIENNPLVPEPKYKRMKVVEILEATSPKLSENIKKLVYPQGVQSAKPGQEFFALVEIDEKTFDYREFNKFIEHANKNFVLTSPGSPDINIVVVQRASGPGFAGVTLLAQAPLQSGAKYSIKSTASQNDYVWDFKPELQLGIQTNLPISQVEKNKFLSCSKIFSL